MTKQTRNRDSSGKFVCDSASTPEEIPLIQPQNLWKKFKYFISLIIVLILSLPWGMIMMEPAKNYTLAFGEGVKNITSNLKDSFCACSIRPIQPMM